ncbi:TPA: hypothetical protein ACIDZU_002105 [Pseudomonas aeruginosa]
MTTGAENHEDVRNLQDITYKAILIEAIDTQELKQVAKTFHLDSPRTGDTLRSDGLLRISGWVLLTSKASDAKIVVNKSSNPVESGLDVSRPDVVQRILSLNPTEVPELVKCGFSISCNLQEINTVDLRVNGIYYPLKQISAIESSANTESLSCAWRNYHSNALESVDLDSVSLLGSIGIADFDAFVWGSVRAVGLASFVKQHEEDSAKERIERFVSFVSNPSLHQVFLTDAVNHGFLRLPNPFGAGEAECNQSIHCKGNITGLRFVCEYGECFYVLQHVGSADAVYFPNRKLILLLKHVSVEMVKSFAWSMARDLGALITASLSAEEKIFRGIIASHGRPYHFYYDVATAVYSAYSSDLLRKVPKIIYYSGADFCSFKDVFSLECDESIYTPDQISRISKEQRGFYLHLGEHYSEQSYKLARGFDQLMLTNARKKFDYNDLDYVAVQACYPLIWFGLTVEKRSWIEQIEGIANIINSLSVSYPKLGVIFDGWTSPLNPTDGDTHQAAEDTKVAKEIENLLEKPVKIVSLIGVPSDKKIIFARITDIFVTNSGTCSLHVSRFAQRPGVGHLNTRMIDMPDHIRPNIHLVDKKHIIDEPGSVSKRMDFVSYSIDWKVIHDMVEEILRD